MMVERWSCPFGTRHIFRGELLHFQGVSWNHIMLPFQKHLCHLLTLDPESGPLHISAASSWFWWISYVAFWGDMYNDNYTPPSCLGDNTTWYSLLWIALYMGWLLYIQSIYKNLRFHVEATRICNAIGSSLLPCCIVKMVVPLGWYPYYQPRIHLIQWVFIGYIPFTKGSLGGLRIPS